MTTVAHESPRVARPPLPSWRAALVSALFGWFFASCFVGLLAIIALELGFLGRSSGSGLRGWPYPEAGWASVVANSVVWLLILALASLLIRGFLADRSGRPISSATVFAVLLVTGFAPFVPRGLLNLPALIALLATAALLRFVSGFGPAPLPKRTTAKLIAAGTAFLAIPAFHATTHPLWRGNTFFEEKPEKVILSLRNAGLSTLELKSLSLRLPTVPTPPAELRSVRLSEEPAWEATQRFPFRLEPRSEGFVHLNLRPRGCGLGQARASATFTYEVLGRTRTETLPVDIPRRACLGATRP